MIEENSAAYIPQEIGATCYHCPRTNCDGHLYLRQAELGIEGACPKCGLAVTVGKWAGHLSRNWPAPRILLALLVALILGFLLGLASTHF